MLIVIYRGYIFQLLLRTAFSGRLEPSCSASPSVCIIFQRGWFSSSHIFITAFFRYSLEGFCQMSITLGLPSSYSGQLVAMCSADVHWLLSARSILCRYPLKQPCPDRYSLGKEEIEFWDTLLGAIWYQRFAPNACWCLCIPLLPFS